MSGPSLREENERLRQRLGELEELLGAIRGHHVDAFVVDSPAGKRIFVLESADRPYRSLIEEMQQGAITLDEQGLILYCNRRFAEMLGRGAASVVATSLCDWVAEPQREAARALLARGLTGPATGELRLATAAGTEIPVYLSLDRMSAESGATLGGVVTDLSEQLAHKQLAAAEELARSVLDQACEAIVVCDERLRVLRRNGAARALSGPSSGAVDFSAEYPLQRRDGGDVRECFERALAGREVRGVEARLERPGGPTCDLLLSVAPLRRARGEPAGLVVSLADITESKRLAERSAAQARELAEASRRKDRFLAMLGHELRNPLSAMRNTAELLRRLAPQEAKLRTACDLIGRQVEHMTQLTEKLLDASRVAHGKIHLRKERVDLRSLARAAIEDHRAALEKAGLELDLRLLDAELWALADPTRVAQILGNLLQNAIKFTPRGGTVRVELEVERGGFAVLAVEDSGVGIDPEFLDSLFLTFQQADPEHGGLGLGLALVKGLAEAHGGSARAMSDGGGRGARFEVRLPLEEAREPEAVSPDPAEVPSWRILVIGDAPEAARSLRVMLELHGQRVRTAALGDDGLAAARRFCPDLVLCDLEPEAGDAAARLVRELRADPLTRKARLVALGGGERAAAPSGESTGFDDYLKKPLDPAALRRLLGGAGPAN